MEIQSIRDQLRALDEQRQQLVEAAKKEALDKVNAGLEELRRLGFYYHLKEGKRKGE